ncbi:MAG: hypothetical protein R2789_16960 [Microthrixaceae bacterium]
MSAPVPSRVGQLAPGSSVGIDLCSVERMAAARSGRRVSPRVFTGAEMAALTCSMMGTWHAPPRSCSRSRKR